MYRRLKLFGSQVFFFYLVAFGSSIPRFKKSVKYLE